MITQGLFIFHVRLGVVRFRDQPYGVTFKSVGESDRLDVSRKIYISVDSPYLGFPYFNFLGGYQRKNGEGGKLDLAGPSDENDDRQPTQFC